MTFSPDHPGASVRPSPNFGERIGCERPDLLILHYTGMDSPDGSETWLCSTESQVSSHYLVHLDGRIVQMVREQDRAWHAGRSFWAGQTDINSHSVGIEIVNPGHFLGYPDFPDVQIDAVIALCRDICLRQDIAPRQVLAHSDIAPGRKIDPGEKFPWARLWRAGVGHWVEAMPIGPAEPLSETAVLEMQRLISGYGYGLEAAAACGHPFEAVVEAFQRHFRTKRVDGIVDSSTLETLRRLVARSPR